MHSSQTSDRIFAWIKTLRIMLDIYRFGIELEDEASPVREFVAQRRLRAWNAICDSAILVTGYRENEILEETVPAGAVKGLKKSFGKVVQDHYAEDIMEVVEFLHLRGVGPSIEIQELLSEGLSEIACRAAAGDLYS